jgi:UDP-N-acetylglucosamine/UDP-N-acetylgalactosamine diphosphorylase
VPCIDEKGCKVKPAENNAAKFEMFIFDALKHAGKSIVMEVVREEEFSPVKNAKGESSPDTARQSMINLFGKWLREAGIEVPTDGTGNVTGSIEISPLYALDAKELKEKIDTKVVFNGELNLQKQ